MDDKEFHNLLFSAIHHQNDSLLDDLLRSESSKILLDTPGQDGGMLLHAAVLEDCLSCVKCLLKFGANPNVLDTIRAKTPLHLAVELNREDIVKALLELDRINLELRDDRNLSSYEVALFCDNQHLADLIESRSNDINQIKNNFYSIMNQACSSNEPDLVRELMEKHAKNFSDKLSAEWLSEDDRKLLAATNLQELINWSSSSWNDVTLLFKSASKGHTEICRILIEYGATAKCNENTNYSPIYVAAYGGYTDTVKLLLDSFPSLVRETTIEKWTILHACCLQGHSDTASLILTYPYPDKLKQTYVSRSGLYEYSFAFDLNAQDAAGQTVVFLAVSANNEKLLDTLLRFNVEAKLIGESKSLGQPNSIKNSWQSSQVPSQTDEAKRARIIPDRPKLVVDDAIDKKPSNQLEKIISRLKRIGTKETDLSEKQPTLTGDDCKFLICPFEMDTYCDYNSKTALHLAVFQQYHSIATTLLVNGSNPNLPILCRETNKTYIQSNSDTGLNWLRSSKSTCLREASRLNDEAMCDILIRYGASDNQDNLALKVAAANKNNLLISKFLSLKSNVDPEYKINNKCNVEFASRYKQSQKLSKISHGDTTTTFSSMFPNYPVMIDWQNLKCIKRIDPQWLIDASLIHNKRLKHLTTSLIAITRLDLSSNGLKTIHPVIFRLPSLKEMNLSNNRLESLIDYGQRGSISCNSKANTSKLIESHKIAMKRSKSTNISSINLEGSNIIDLNEPQEWDLPYLETLDLHDNRLIALPDCLFELPRLSEIDVSSNQIRQFPPSFWTAPSLKEVVASGNLLDDLPKLSGYHKDYTTPKIRFDLNHSPNDEESSMTSNLSASNDKSDGSFFNSLGSDSNQHPNLVTVMGEISSLQLSCFTSSVVHLNHWMKRVEVVNSNNLSSKIHGDEDNNGLEDNPTISKITYLNLSHNSFSTIPQVLACIATDLTRLNLSHNRITSLGSIRLYPAKLKSIDLSNNQITSWFDFEVTEGYLAYCYAENKPRHPFGHDSIACSHKTHDSLEGLKSINLSHNLLREIQIASEPDLSSRNRVHSSSLNNDINHTIRDSLIYPNATILDLSFNKIQQVPKDISELKDLSVFNVGGNVSITSLPAELGLNHKLWNLGIGGCSLNEPLKSIVESTSYRTLDIIGYLRSILEEAKPYARMKLMLVGLQGIGKTSLLEQMRSEGTSSRRKIPEHWTRRMGHSSKSNIRNQRGITLSTVGVDIHDWIFTKRVPRNQLSFGPVTFSTWDFGGQKEFYATHRYFLSRRSMYLVVWRLTDGIEGIDGIQQWLVNIQSRAPGSPVVIVGTHEDMIDGGEAGDTVKYLQTEVLKRFINISDHDKCGLPNVMDSIIVSTKTKYNIRNLCNRIYDIVFSLKCPGSAERLLEQKIPATYLYLEEIISWVVHERQQQKKEPVLTYSEFRKVTSEQLYSKYKKKFRDLEPTDSRDINYNSELQQASRFLHENGVLLHYEDANLRDLYFLDPQWLCDILSHVVTIREINPHVKNGLMKISDLGHLFKSIDINMSGGIQSYVVNLLNKFEVALTWNSQYLLIPSLLPFSPNDISEEIDDPMRMAPRVRGRSAARKYDLNRVASRASSIGPGISNSTTSSDKHLKSITKLKIQAHDSKAINRLVLLRYLPAGFLARLQSGILSDPIFDEICADIRLRLIEHFNDHVAMLKDSVGSCAGWACWRNGITLSLQHESTINSKFKPGDTQATLLTIEEYTVASKDCPLRQDNFKVECVTISNSLAKSPDGSEVYSQASSKWCEFDISQYSHIVMISVPSWNVQIMQGEKPVLSFDLEPYVMARLLANAVDHIDNLLEDWYPSLGTRFAHTLGGNYLVTRIVPCNSCFTPITNSGAIDDKQHSVRSSRHDTRAARFNNRIKFSIMSSTDNQTENSPPRPIENSSEIHCFYVEHCILTAFDINSSAMNPSAARKYSLNFYTSSKPKKATNFNLTCPRHGSIPLSSLAPDIIFGDVPDTYKIDNNQIERCKLIGRGTFGFVFRGNFQSSSQWTKNQSAEVALKLLQPVDPGNDADTADILAYNNSKTSWIREPFQSACKSYCTARHEINILQALRHPNIVLFIGLCVKPLAIVLELAPMGSLSDVFKSYKRAGMRIYQSSIQKTILQIAKALEFLHQQKVIYRDLKAENVLVWNFPSPYATQQQLAQVELKLADYGISRQALFAGIWKGFAGTINFLAPEILRHNGDEEYTEKVDCFSFGMFMYELLTLRPPFKHGEGTKSNLADGRRPALTTNDLIYPNHVIDLMNICWSQEPRNRPTASQIVSIVSTPEFMQLLDVAVLDSIESVNFCCSIHYSDKSVCSLDFWIGVGASAIEVLSTNQSYWTQHQILKFIDITSKHFTCMCVVRDALWFTSIDGTIHVLPARSRILKSTYCKINQQAEEKDPPTNLQSLYLNTNSHGKIKQIEFVNEYNRVLLLSVIGELWVIKLETMECQQLGDKNSQFECMALQEKTSKQSHGGSGFKVFCGQLDGVSCLDIQDDLLNRKTFLPLADNLIDLSGERIIEPNQTTKITSILASNDCLWTSAGCTVHLWKLEDRCVARKLDCWKLVPCSESLESINIENYNQQARSSLVTSLVRMKNQLYIGTSHGCFMVVEADSLKPIIVFKPYESDIFIYKPSIIENNSHCSNKASYLVTVGRGYRDLMRRYVNSMDNLEVSSTNVAILWSSNYSDS